MSRPTYGSTDLTDRGEVKGLLLISEVSSKYEHDGENHVSTVSNQHDPQKSSKHIVLKKELGLFTAIAAIINMVLGTGLFYTPTTILSHTRSFGLSITLWVVGGVISLCGALCYLELALLINKSGSTYIYIKEAYSFGRKKPWMDQFGSFCGFVVAWTNLMILQPLSTSIGALAFGSYMCRPFFINCVKTPDLPVKLVALSLPTTMLLINIFSVKLAARFLNLAASLKLLVITIIIVLGLWKTIQNGFPADMKEPFAGSATSFSSISLGLYGILYGYDGWDTGLMLLEETKNSRRNLGLALFIAIPLVTLVFVLVNTSYFSVLSYSQILSSDSVGLTFGYAVFGSAGMIVIYLMVVSTMIGGSHSGLLDSSRELLVCAREGSMPKFLSGIHVTLKTPVLSLVFEVALAVILILIGDIEKLIDAFNALEWTTFGAAFFGLIVMRITEPDRPRPFKVLLFFPCLMVLVSLGLVVLPFWQNPYPQLMGFGAASLAIPLYCFFMMEKPCKLRPKAIDRISRWLISITSRIFNTQLHSKI